MSAVADIADYRIELDTCETDKMLFLFTTRQAARSFFISSKKCIGFRSARFFKHFGGRDTEIDYFETTYK